MSSRTSRTPQSQASKKQRKQPAGSVVLSITAVSTSALRNANDGSSSYSGVQGGFTQSEPPRPIPSFRASSAISPSESISVRSVPTSSGGEALSSNDRMSAFSKGSAARRQVGTNQTPSTPGQSVTGSQHSSLGASSKIPADSASQASWSSRRTPSGSTMQAPPSSAAPTQQRSLASSVQSAGSRTYSRAGGGSSAGALQQNYAQDCSRGYQDYSTGYTGGAVQQQPAGISIGVPPSAQGAFNFSYNQADNRKLTINNNAPGNVTTTDNHVFNVDNSNHHNDNASRGNNSTYSAHNSGNMYTDVRQKAKTTDPARLYGGAFPPR